MTPSTRPLHWSIRRELWENRSITMGPLIAAGIVLFGYSIRLLTLPRRMPALLALEPEAQRNAFIVPYSMAAAVVMFSAVVVGVFYCLDALHGERRDRSILFWKSLPVSDLTTVVSKASIPLVVLPLFALAVSAVTQLVMLLMNTFVLAGSGWGAGILWRHLPVFQMPLIQVYGLAVHALWHAPMYAWLLLVSAWARRTPFLWAFLPLAAIGAVERIAFGTSYFGKFLGYRLMGAIPKAFVVPGSNHGLITRLSQLDPLGFLGSAGLWSGLAVAALFLAAAIRLRRRGEPI